MVNHGKPHHFLYVASAPNVSTCPTQWMEALQMAVSDNKLEDPALYIRLGLASGPWIKGMDGTWEFTPRFWGFPALEPVLEFGSLFTKMKANKGGELVLNLWESIAF